jgi:GNAT superfamily N-acetyltransferase
MRARCITTASVTLQRVTVRPVTPATWPDFERLFDAPGAPHYCYCTPYRIHGDLDKRARRATMASFVEDGTPIGVLAYEGGVPVGWCSVAPRQTFARLARSRTMPRVTPEDAPTWTILCFFVPRDHRGRGIAGALLRGAVAYARKSRAVFLEGYPFDTAGISSTHRGHSSIFAAEGFRRHGSRWELAIGRRVTSR